MLDINSEMKIFKTSKFYLDMLERTERKNTILELENYIIRIKLFNYDLYKYIIALYEFDNFLIHI